MKECEEARAPALQQRPLTHGTVSESVVLQVCSLNQQHLGACQIHKFSSSIPVPLNQKPSGWGPAVCISIPDVLTGFPCGSAGEESVCNAGDLGLITGLGRSPGEGKGYPLQYSGLENSMDYTVHGVGQNSQATQFLVPFKQFSSVQSLSRVQLFATP